jgi:16S rRNA (cytidine1402-2'-O)-methyltransferase
MAKISISQKTEFSSNSPKLLIVSTPIGNLKDITFRAIEALQSADIVLCEDTRVTQKLLNAYQISTQCVHFDDYSSQKQIEKYLNLIKAGKIIALVSDAGTPLVSDPGYRLVTSAINEDIKIESFPGACSVINALVLSGLKNSNFSFLGFLPHENSAKQKVLERYSQFETTLISFESPNRVLETLEIAKVIFPTAKVCICREMTKRFEEVTRGTFTEVINHYSEKYEIKGEVIILIEVPPSQPSIDENTIKELIKTLLIQGISLKDTVHELSLSYKIPKNKIYDLALSVKNENKF